VSINDVTWLIFLRSDQDFLNQMFEFMQVAKPINYQEFENLIHTHEETGVGKIRTAIDVMALLLQTPEQIKIGLDDIFHEASKDNFKCKNCILIFSLCRFGTIYPSYLTHKGRIILF
jgi:hypothetical protein